MQYYYETIVLKIVYFGRKLLACSVEKQIYVITLIVSRKTELLPFTCVWFWQMYQPRKCWN